MMDERGENWPQDVEALKPGDSCEFRYPARKDWLPGVVVKNGGNGFWHVEGEGGEGSRSIYIEHVRTPQEAKPVPRHDADPQVRFNAMRDLASEVCDLLDRGEIAQAQGANYELKERLDADLFMQRMVERRRVEPTTGGNE